jgi:hypothetical protein
MCKENHVAKVKEKMSRFSKGSNPGQETKQIIILIVALYEHKRGLTTRKSLTHNIVTT